MQDWKTFITWTRIRYSVTKWQWADCAEKYSHAYLANSKSRPRTIARRFLARSSFGSTENSALRVFRSFKVSLVKGMALKYRSSMLVRGLVEVKNPKPVRKKSRKR